MKAIVGYTGFVGSNLLQFYAFDKFYNSKNFEEAIGKHFEEIILDKKDCEEISKLFQNL